MKIARFTSGQSLVEILIAVAIGTLMIIAAVTLIAPALKISGDLVRGQTANALTKELFENVRIFSEANWGPFSSLTSGPGTVYYMNATTTPFAAVTGTQTIAVGTSTFDRYFYVEPVMRNAGGDIDPLGSITDPSTKRVTVFSKWAQGGTTSTIVTYLTRWQSRVAAQTDWSAGRCEFGPLRVWNNRFASSSQIDYATTTGSIVIALAPPTIPDTPAAANIIYAFAFKEGSGSLTYDSQVSEVGVIDGDTTWTDGRYCFGLNMRSDHFNSLDGRVSVQNSDYLAEGNQVTVMAWIKPRVVANMNIIAKSDPGYAQHEWLLSVDGSGRLSFSVNASNTTAVAVSDSTTLFNDLALHHVAGVYNGSNVRVYVDGVSVDSTPPALLGSIQAYSRPICIGATYDGNLPTCGYGSVNFDGLIDEVRMFDRGLTSAEINDEMRRSDP